MPEAERSIFSAVGEAAGSLADDLRQMLSLRWRLARLELQNDLKAVRRLLDARG